MSRRARLNPTKYSRPVEGLSTLAVPSEMMLSQVLGSFLRTLVVRAEI
jgi:hypothetical protein